MLHYKKKQNIAQSGQTFVEFMLLLLILFGFATAFMNGTNERIGILWKGIVERVIDDPAVNLQI